MSYLFPPVYQPYIQLWSPFSRIEPISEVYTEKVTKTEHIRQENTSLVIYDKTGRSTEIKSQKNIVDRLI